MFDIKPLKKLFSSQGESSCRKQIDVLLSAMNEKEFIVMRAIAEALKKSRETDENVIIFFI